MDARNSCEYLEPAVPVQDDGGFFETSRRQVGGVEIEGSCWRGGIHRYLHHIYTHEVDLQPPR